MLSETIRSAVLVCALASAAAAQTTWYVDDDATPPGSGTQTDPFPTIGAAIATAIDGDTVLVAPGAYPGDFELVKELEVRSTGGPEITILQNPSIRLGEAGDFHDKYVLEGFTLEGATGRAVDMFGGTLRGCVLRDNPGTGLHITHDGTIENTTIARNGVGLDGWHGYYWGTFRNVILWGNAVDVDEIGCVDFSHCAGAYGGFCQSPEAHLYGNPGFWDLDGGDLHLHPRSHCIGSGAPAGTDRGALPYDAEHAPTPRQYCQGAPNSSGPGARMGWAGTPNIAANDFRLQVSGATAGQLGLFFYGPVSVQLPFGDGFRCVGAGATGTFRLQPAQGIDGTGFAERQLDFGAPPAGTGAGAVMLGSFWNFQFWYRDPGGPQGTGFNLSDGLEVGFGA